MNDLMNTEKAVVIEETTAERQSQIDHAAAVQMELAQALAQRNKVASEQGKADGAKITEDLALWKPVHEEVARLAMSGHSREAAVLVLYNRQMLGEVHNVTEGMMQRASRNMQDSKQRSERTSGIAMTAFIGISAVSIAISLLLSHFTMRALDPTLPAIIVSGWIGPEE